MYFLNLHGGWDNARMCTLLIKCTSVTRLLLKKEDKRQRGRHAIFDDTPEFRTENLWKIKPFPGAALTSSLFGIYHSGCLSLLSFEDKILAISPYLLDKCNLAEALLVRKFPFFYTPKYALSTSLIRRTGIPLSLWKQYMFQRPNYKCFFSVQFTTSNRYGPN